MAVYGKLEDREVNILPMVIELLREHRGRSNAITNAELRQQLIDLGYQDIGQIRMRKIINHIRNNDILICLKGCSHGYYITTDIEEIKNYIGSLNERKMAIDHTKQIIERQLDILLAD